MQKTYGQFKIVKSNSYGYLHFQMKLDHTINRDYGLAIDIPIECDKLEKIKKVLENVQKVKSLVSNKTDYYPCEVKIEKLGDNEYTFTIEVRNKLLLELIIKNIQIEDQM